MNKLIQGDCLESLKTLEDNSVDALITDPPDNVVEKMGGSIHLFRQSEKDGNNTYNKDTMDYDTGFDQIAWIKEALRTLKPGGNIVIFNDWENMGDIAKDLRKHKIKVKSLNHWQKTNPQPAEWRRRFVPGREYFLHAVKPGKYEFNVDSLHKGVFELGLTKQSEKANGKHPNQKPLKLMEDIIRILTKENDVVLDPFCGSGSTGVACKNINRDFIGMELSPEYIKIAEARINNAVDKSSL